MSAEKKRWAFLSESKSMGSVTTYQFEMTCNNCRGMNLMVIAKGTSVSLVRNQAYCQHCGCRTNGVSYLKGAS